MTKGDPINCRFGSGGEADPEDEAMTNDEIRSLEAQADAYQAQADEDRQNAPYKRIAELERDVAECNRSIKELCGARRVADEAAADCVANYEAVLAAQRKYVRGLEDRALAAEAALAKAREALALLDGFRGNPCEDKYWCIVCSQCSQKCERVEYLDDGKPICNVCTWKRISALTPAPAAEQASRLCAVADCPGEPLADRACCEVHDAGNAKPSAPAHRCDTCLSDFATCGAKRVVFGIDRDKSARGADADKVLECDGYKPSAPAEKGESK